jgi:bifunctional UDP-N-acetylglucosamine pyrophosphorylase/glucosamine-1-phosphate N-acetyltransferase
MEAIILAAGESSRMHPLSDTRPKVMLPLAGKPILEHLMITARTAGIQDFIIVVGYLDNLIRKYFGDGSRWQVKIRYVTQQHRLGTANAIAKARELIPGDFLVMNGDMLVSVADIQNLKNAKGHVIGAMHREQCSGLGIIQLDGSQITQIHEKPVSPDSNLANVGIYRFTPKIMTFIEATDKSLRGEFEITDTIALMIQAGEIVRCHPIEFWLDFTFPWDLLDANEILLQNMKSESSGCIEEGVTISGSVKLGKNSVLRAGSYVTGPVFIGEGCQIGPYCNIRPATSIGNGCHIGAFVEIKNSIIMGNTKIPHLNYIGDSVIGENCNFGAGSKIANLRFDNHNVKIGGIDTGRRKLGAIIGDNVEVGVNAAINVGTLIGNGCQVGPNTTVSGVLAPSMRWY